MKRIVRLIICLMVSFTLMEAPIINSAQAGMITTDTVVENMERAQTQQKVVDFIERSDVKDQMMSLGVSAEEASSRVAQLSDSELYRISGQIDNSIAGGEVAGVLGIILLVVLILYIVQRI